MTTAKLNIKLKNEEQYVRVISGIVAGGLSKQQMTIIILLLKLQKQLNTTEITQSMKEKVRIHMGLSSQTMHNYWNKLKRKGLVIGKYKDYKFNAIIRHNVELKISYED